MLVRNTESPLVCNSVSAESTRILEAESTQLCAVLIHNLAARAVKTVFFRLFLAILNLIWE